MQLIIIMETTRNDQFTAAMIRITASTVNKLECYQLLNYHYRKAGEENISFPYNY